NDFPIICGDELDPGTARSPVIDEVLTVPLAIRCTAVLLVVEVPAKFLLEAWRDRHKRGHPTRLRRLAGRNHGEPGLNRIARQVSVRRRRSLDQHGRVRALSVRNSRRKRQYDTDDEAPRPVSDHGFYGAPARLNWIEIILTGFCFRHVTPLSRRMQPESLYTEKYSVTIRCYLPPVNIASAVDSTTGNHVTLRQQAISPAALG